MTELLHIAQKTTGKATGGKLSGTPFFQPKLKVNQPNDSYEKEADQVAEQVMRKEAPVIKDTFFSPVNVSTVSRKCTACEQEEKLQRKEDEGHEETTVSRKEKLQDGGADQIPHIVQRKCAACEEEEKKIQRKETKTSAEVGASVMKTLNTSGQKLDAGTRGFMEDRFGHDFGDVRIHTDSQANESAKSIQALAYTHGNHIVFGEGQYNPDSDSGKKLLAHELTHTIQQNGGVSMQIQRAVNNVEINCGDSQIRFAHDGEITSYALDQCDITDGNYNATVSVSPGRVEFNLGAVPAETHFRFHYSLNPGQPNPNSFFAGQRTVPILCTHTPSRTGMNREIPVTFESIPLSLMPAVTGITSRLPAMGDLGWLNAGGRMRWGTMMGGTTWNPMWNMFARNTMLLDRIVDVGDGSTRATSDLLLALEPRLQSQLTTGGPYSWSGRGFSEAELRSLQSLVRRMNTQGIANLSDVELALLRRAAQLHFDGAMAGSPFASYTPPNATAPFLNETASAGETRYRVRVRVNSANVLDGITPSEFNEMGANDALFNPGEFDMLVTTNANGELQSVQRVAAGADTPGWMMRNAGMVRWGGRLLLVGGAAMSAYQIASATPAERPRVVVREGGSWGGGYLGAELGAGACIAFGVATEGFGLLLCGMVGGVSGGFLGSHAATAAYDTTTGLFEDFAGWMENGIRGIYFGTNY